MQHVTIVKKNKIARISFTPAIGSWYVLDSNVRSPSDDNGFLLRHSGAFTPNTQLE